MRTYEFRLYPNREQRRRLMACLIESRHIYNAMLERTKQHYQETGAFLFQYDLNRLFKGTGGAYVPASTVQCLAGRLDKALRAYLVRKRTNTCGGFPRFKSGNQWHSIPLRQYGSEHDFWVEGRYLRVPSKLGKAIKIKRHRPMEGTPKTSYLVLRADGHWYALIVCEMAESETAKVSAPDTRPVVGIDVGLKSFLTDSDGHSVENPRFYRASQAVLRRKQRVLSRRIKGSHRRRKAAREVAKTHLKIARQRRDFHFKSAKHYADCYRVVVVEDLVVSRMVHGNLAKSIHDASWGAFLDILTDKAARTGGQVLRVNPRFTTQTCFQCGELVQKSLSVRTHSCPSCGYVADRDLNAARNILKAGAPPSGTLADGSADEPRSCPL
jgi:putative transposase